MLHTEEIIKSFSERHPNRYTLILNQGTHLYTLYTIHTLHTCAHSRTRTRTRTRAIMTTLVQFPDVTGCVHCGRYACVFRLCVFAGKYSKVEYNVTVPTSQYQRLSTHVTVPTSQYPRHSINVSVPTYQYQSLSI